MRFVGLEQIVDDGDRVAAAFARVACCRAHVLRHDIERHPALCRHECNTWWDGSSLTAHTRSLQNSMRPPSMDTRSPVHHALRPLALPSPLGPAARVGVKPRLWSHAKLERRTCKHTTTSRDPVVACWFSVRRAPLCARSKCWAHKRQAWSVLRPRGFGALAA